MADDLTPLDERVRLVELVDRVLDRGVVLRGDVTISVAGIDLVYLELRLLLSGIEALADRAVSNEIAAAGERRDDRTIDTEPGETDGTAESNAADQADGGSS